MTFGSIFDAPNLRRQLEKTEKKVADPNFWSNSELSQQPFPVDPRQLRWCVRNRSSVFGPYAKPLHESLSKLTRGLRLSLRGSMLKSNSAQQPNFSKRVVDCHLFSAQTAQGKQDTLAGLTNSRPKSVVLTLNYQYRRMTAQ